MPPDINGPGARPSAGVPCQASACSPPRPTPPEPPPSPPSPCPIPQLASASLSPAPLLPFRPPRFADASAWAGRVAEPPSESGVQPVTDGASGRLPGWRAHARGGSPCHFSAAAPPAGVAGSRSSLSDEAFGSSAGTGTTSASGPSCVPMRGVHSSMPSSRRVIGPPRVSGRVVLFHSSRRASAAAAAMAWETSLTAAAGNARSAHRTRAAVVGSLAGSEMSQRSRSATRTCGTAARQRRPLFRWSRRMFRAGGRQSWPCWAGDSKTAMEGVQAGSAPWAGGREKPPRH